MEKEVIERLERVNESIILKKEKLQTIQSEIQGNLQEIEFLREQVRHLDDVGSLDFETAQQKDMLQNYSSRNSQLRRNIEEVNEQTEYINLRLEEYNSKIKDILTLAATDSVFMERHCQEIESNINECQEAHKMVVEDLASAEAMQSEITQESKSSTRIVHKF